jgi:hypothetical protein
MSHHWGYVAAIVSALLFGVSSTLNKIALENVNPTIIAGMIYFVAGVFLFVVHLSPLCPKILAKLDTVGTVKKNNEKRLQSPCLCDCLRFRTCTFATIEWS